MDIEEQYDKIYRYCYFKTFDKQLAQDITQETFLRFFKKGSNVNPKTELPYLYTIAKNLCVDAFRKKTFLSLESGSKEPAYDPTEQWINDIALRSIVSKLSQDEQDILYLRYASEISITSISKILGISRFAIRRKHMRAMKWIEEELRKGEMSE